MEFDAPLLGPTFEGSLVRADFSFAHLGVLGVKFMLNQMNTAFFPDVSPAFLAFLLQDVCSVPWGGVVRAITGFSFSI